MAPTQLLLEGPAIEPLLERVWAEHGPEVKIVKAERVRVGGIVGFFAREQFEVTVELDDGPAGGPAGDRPRRGGASALPADDRAALPAAPTSRPQGIEALLAAAEDADSRPTRTAPPPPPPAAAAPALADGGFDSIFRDVLTGAEPAPAAGGLALRTAPPAPAARAAREDPATPADLRVEPPPAVQDGAPARSAAPATAATALVPEVVDPPEPPPVAVQHAPHPAVQSVVQQALVDAGLVEPGTVLLPDTPLLQAVAPGSLRSELVDPDDADLLDADLLGGDDPLGDDLLGDDLLGDPGRSGDPGDGPLEPPAPEPPAPTDPAPSAPEPPARAARVRSFAPVPSPRPAPEPPSALAAVAAGLVAAAAAERRAADPASDPSSVPASDAPPAPEGRRGRRAASRRESSADELLAERLAGLGVPAPWLWDLPASRAEALRELAARIADTPAQARRGTTSASPVVAVLADVADALPVAHRLALGLGLDAGEVLLAGPRAAGVAKDRCLPSRPDLLAEADRARAAERPLVVVLPAPVGAAPAARASLADTLDALDPEEVWAVVDATRRIDDTGRWLDTLAGERGVDAVALVNVDATSAPAAALGLPAPVVLLEDRPATPEVWVTTLAARLAAQDLHLAQQDADARREAAR